MRCSTSRLAPALALIVALAAGCAGDGDDTALDTPSPTATASNPSPPATSPTPTTAPSPTASGTSDTREWATCVSTRASMQVSYPAGWTVRDYPDGGCAYFDPEPFEVERGTEAHGMTIRLDVEPADFERSRDIYLEGRGNELIADSATEVAGLRAHRVEDRNTEGPSGGVGHRLSILVDLGNEQTLVLSTNEKDADDFDLGREVLEQMAERLERA